MKMQERYTTFLKWGRKLKGREVKVLAAIIQQVEDSYEEEGDEYEYVVCRREEIAKRTGLSERSVSRAVWDLIGKQHIESQHCAYRLGFGTGRAPNKHKVCWDREDDYEPEND